MNEQALIESLRQKDHSAFKEIVATWQNMIYNTSLGIVQDEEDAEDIAQEVFIKVFEGIKDFNQDSKFSTWIYRIAVTTSLDHLRKKKRKKRFAFIQSLYGKNDELVELPDFVHPGIQAEQRENAAILFKAMKTLPANQNAAFVLNKMEGMSYKQIGDVLNVSEAAVDSLLQRAKRNLQKKLANHFAHQEGFLK